MRARPSPPTNLPDRPARHEQTHAGPSTASVPSALAAQRERNRAIRAHAERLANTSEWGALPLAIVPLQERPLAAVPAAMQQRFLARLAERIERAFSANAAVPQADLTDLSEPAQTSALLGQGCALCRGACCTRGSDHAFLGEDSLARVRIENPSLDADALLAAYVAHLPVEHYAESCVYHGATGCALPLLLRSTTCNRYRCGGLTELARALQPSAASVVASANDVSATDVSATDVRAPSATAPTVAVIGVSDNVRLRRIARVCGTTADERPVSD